MEGALVERVPTTEIARLLDETLARTGFSINSMTYQNLLVRLAIAVLRVQEGQHVPLDAALQNELSDTPAYAAAEELSLTSQLVPVPALTQSYPFGV